MLLCAPAGAAAQKGVQVSVPRVQALHPLVLGSLANPASPISRSANRHAAVLIERDKLEKLTPRAAHAYLALLLTATPLERAAASVVAQALVRPVLMRQFVERRRVPAGQPLGRLPSLDVRSGEDAAAFEALKAAASLEPSVPALFDGKPEHGDLDLGGLVMTQQGLFYQGRRIQELGRGGYGIVDAHPKAEGVVLKTIMLRDSRGLAQLREDAVKDDVLTHRLAAAGLGPRGFGVSEAAGSPVVGKERVYGETVHDLIAGGRYGQREHGLVLDLVDRMARERVDIRDLREPNIMLGVTLAEPDRLRGWVIDGQAYRALSPDTSAARVRRAILERPTIRSDWRHASDGSIVGTHLPFLEVLERGLIASGAARLWTRLKLALLDRWRGAPKPTPYQFPSGRDETPIGLDAFVPRAPVPSSASTPAR